MQPILSSGFLRLRHIIGDKSATPPLLPIIPVSASSWWAGVKSGKYPKPIKLGENTTVWRAEDIQDLIDGINNNSATEADQ